MPRAHARGHVTFLKSFGVNKSSVVVWDACCLYSLGSALQRVPTLVTRNSGAATGVEHQRRYDFDVDDGLHDYDFDVHDGRYADSLFSRR